MEVKQEHGRWFARKSKTAKRLEDITDIIRFNNAGDCASIIGNAGRTSFHSYVNKTSQGWKEMYGTTSILSMWGEKDALIQHGVNKAIDCLIEGAGYLYNKDGEVVAVTCHGDKLQSARKAHIDFLEAAGEHGTRIHGIVEDYIKDGKESDEEQVTAFSNWAVENKVKFLASEMFVASKQLFVGGTLDFLAEINGRLYIGDVKTSNYISPKFYYQMAAYALMYEEEYGVTIDDAVIIHMPRKGGFNARLINGIAGDKRAFLGIYAAYKHEKMNRSEVWKST